MIELEHQYFMKFHLLNTLKSAYTKRSGYGHLNIYPLITALILGSALLPASAQAKKVHKKTEIVKKPIVKSPTKVIVPPPPVFEHTSIRNMDITDKDKTFIELREAAKRNDVAASSILANRLSDYEFADYVEYFRIKPRLYDTGGFIRAETDADHAVESFLNRYTGTGIGDRMRNDWLLVLGKRKDWTAFDREYALFALDDDTQVKCYSFMSRLSRGEPAKRVAMAAKAALLDPKYFGEACAEAIPQLVQAKGLSKSEAMAIARSALEINLDTLAKRMGGDDPIADIVRKARSNPSAAFSTFDESEWRQLSEYRALAWGVIGQFLAKKQDPNAIEAFRNQHALGYSALLSPESLEWKVRTALREKDWKFVKESIETMPDWVRDRDPAWTYWYGRAQKELGERKAADEAFQSLAGQYNFYAQLSLEELNVPVTVPPKVQVSEADIKAMESHPAFARSARLYAMNLRMEGNREWNWEVRSMTDRQLLAAAEYGKRLGMLDRTVNTAERTKSEHDFSLRYPTPFIDKLLPITNQIGLDINWAYGLIRQESRFVMNAKSGVGASGLMQVMPTTAQYVAKKIGMLDYRPEKLGDLQTNLVLGSNYLNMVLNDLGGSWGLASAAYNAGPSRSKLWRQTLPKSVEGAIYAETIPFNETRGYVKNVLSNANYYAILSTGKPQSLKQKLGIVQPVTAVNSGLP